MLLSTFFVIQKNAILINCITFPLTLASPINSTVTFILLLHYNIIFILVFITDVSFSYACY